MHHLLEFFFLKKKKSNCPSQFWASPIIIHLQDQWKTVSERRQPPKAPDHLEITTLPFSPVQCKLQPLHNRNWMNPLLKVANFEDSDIFNGE